MSIQAILIVVIVLLATLLLFVGIQVVMIIVELRKAIKRLNAILDDAILGGGLIKPHKLSGIVELLRKGKMRSHGDDTNRV